MDQIGLTGRELLQDVVKNDDRIRLICCGHVHHDFHGQLHQADVYAAPSTGIQFDPRGDHPTFAADAPGYRIIELTDDAFATRVVRLPEARFVPVAD